MEKLDSLGYGPDAQVQCHLDDLFMVVSILDGNQSDFDKVKVTHQRAL
jgi:hypothetical protein